MALDLPALTALTAPDLPREPVPCTRAPEAFFPTDDAALATARTLCAGCPIRSACLDGALERGEPWGVWGGELLDDGAVIPGIRKPGRPRKDAQAA